MVYIGILAIAVSALLALYTASVLAPRMKMDLQDDRHAPIDGLRGFAALFVFFCHAALWLYFAKTGRWSNAPVRLYGNIGLGGVAVFFMITAYLFATKLVRARTAGVDWLKLFVSRVLRLTPLYLFTVLIVAVIVAASSGFRLTQPAQALVPALWHWLGFTVWGAPDLNGMQDTWLIVAGVTWSLRYEWCFYLFLPLMAVLLRVRAPILLIAVATPLAFQISWAALKPELAAPFIGGAMAAWLVTFPQFSRIATHRHASAAALAALVVAASGFLGNPMKPLPLLLISFAFVVIAGGNTLYGALSSRAARLLGEISYSMYLLHGVLLFVMAHWIIGLDSLAAMPPGLYWMIIVGTTPLLVGLCMMTFVLIERPAMRSVTRVTMSLRAADVFLLSFWRSREPLRRESPWRARQSHEVVLSAEAADPASAGTSQTEMAPVSVPPAHLGTTAIPASIGDHERPR